MDKRIYFAKQTQEWALEILSEAIPLRFREIFVVPTSQTRPGEPDHGFYVCSDGHVHVVYSFKSTDVAHYHALMLSAYTVAVALDVGVHIPDTLTRSAVDQTVERVVRALAEHDAEYARGVQKSIWKALEMFFDGAISDYLETPPPGAKKTPPPMPEKQLEQRLMENDILQAAFGYQVTDDAPGGTTPKKELN